MTLKYSMKPKTLLFLIHRWLGIGMCLLFALWFASGIVMMYVEYPELTEAERISRLPEIDASLVSLSPAEAIQGLSASGVYSAVELTTVMGRPIYQYEDIDGSTVMVFADNGELLWSLDASAALLAAELSGFADENIAPTYDALVDLDQWSVSASLNKFRPLHRININDDRGTVVYVSDKTGQVVRDTNLNERFWNWLGSTIHWIYPVQLRKNATLWGQVIIYLSLIGIVSVVTGAIIGFMRIRLRKPYTGTDYSPYKGLMKWHHILGLLSLVFVFTFIFSGLMSMGPWGIFASSTSAGPQVERYLGASNLRLSSLPLSRLAERDEPIKEVQWLQISNQPYLVLTKANGEREVDFGAGSSQSQTLILLGKIGEAIPLLLPESELISLDLIQRYDDYYYSRHNSYRPLPVYRARFGDAESTWYHVDLTSGEIVNRLTDASRMERWLFNGLHSLDFQILLRYRPLWDIVVILLSVIGFGFCVTSIVIAWRRLLA